MENNSSEFDAVLIDVARQALAEGAKSVHLDGQEFPVRKTPSKNLRQVDFDFEGVTYRGIEQNPNTKSRWAQIARKGAKVMQFMQSGSYVAAVANGEITHYSSKKN
jgi:NADPH-dependent glutamate synthase beta subunit-like oxidoreductase